MKGRQTFLWVSIFTALVCSIAPGAVGQNSKTADVPFATAAITVDGVNSPGEYPGAWYQNWGANFGTDGTTLPGAPDFSARWTATHDANNIYLLLEVQDNVRGLGTAQWGGDCVEIFWDAANTKSEPYAGQQNRTRWTGTAWANDSAAQVGTSVVVDTGTMWTCEWAFPKNALDAAIPPDGLLGFDMKPADNDTGGVGGAATNNTREINMFWGSENTAREDWNHSNTWGNLKLLPPGGGGGGSQARHQQCAGPNFEVVMEAEDFDAAVAGVNNSNEARDWQLVTNPGAAGFSGTGVIQVLPNGGPNQGNVVTAIQNGPHVDYIVNFTQTGIHYVYVRALDPNGSDDSVHWGLNGTPVGDSGVGGSGPRIGFGNDQTNTWEWEADDNDNTQLATVRALINVPSAGEHTFSLWMREDGALIDKIVLSPTQFTSQAQLDALVPCAPTGGEGEGEGGPQTTIIANINPPFIQEGDYIVLTAPPGTGHQWKIDGADIAGATDRQLVFPSITMLDEGTYTVTYDDGTKVLVTTPPFVLTVKAAGTIPVGGLLGLVALGVLCAAGGATAIRRKTR